MFHRILVPLDGSKLAERALPHVMHFARIFDAQVVLFQVLDSSPYLDEPRAVEPLNWQIRKAQADLYLQNLAALLRTAGLNTEHVLREGRAAETIIDFAHAENIDLLALTTHGASGLSRWNASSIAQKVLDKIFLPLLLVRSYPPVSGEWASGDAQALERALAEEQSTPAVSAAAASLGSTNALVDERYQAEPVQPAIPEEAHYRRILMPIDTSRRAECALAAATSLLQADTSLLLSAVLRQPDLPIPSPYPADIQELIDRLMDLSRQAVTSYMEEQQRRLGEQVTTRLVENDNISTALYDIAEEEDVDLVVLCAHGSTGGSQWPYGSVARNYIEHGDRNVLIIQDVPRVHIRTTAAEQAAEKYGRR